MCSSSSMIRMLAMQPLLLVARHDSSGVFGSIGHKRHGLTPGGEASVGPVPSFNQALKSFFVFPFAPVRLARILAALFLPLPGEQDFKGVEVLPQGTGGQDTEEPGTGPAAHEGVSGGGEGPNDEADLRVFPRPRMPPQLFPDAIQFRPQESRAEHDRRDGQNRRGAAGRQHRGNNHWGRTVGGNGPQGRNVCPLGSSPCGVRGRSVVFGFGFVRSRLSSRNLSRCSTAADQTRGARTGVGPSRRNVVASRDRKVEPRPGGRRGRPGWRQQNWSCCASPRPK